MGTLKYFSDFFNTQKQNWMVFIAVVFSSSLLFFYGTGLHPIYHLTWLAPIPIIWYLLKTELRVALIAGFLSYLLGSLNMLAYLAIHVPFYIAFITIIVQSVVFVIGLWIFSYCHSKNKILSLLVLPCFWVAYEYLLATFSPHGSFGSLAYSQSEFIEVIQIAAYVGIWGITFCLFFIPTLIVFAVTEGWKYSILLSLFIILIGILSIKLSSTKQNEATLKVGMIANKALLKNFNKNNISSIDTILNSYFQAAEQLVNSGIQLLVLPEKIIIVSQQNVAKTKQKLLEFTSKTKLLLVIGLTIIENETKHNVAWVMDEEGFIGQYNKHYLVPGWEADYQKGNETLIFSKWGLTIGVAICKDMDFPTLLRVYSKKEVDLMLVPAWDFGQDAQLHNNMAKLRAVEGGFSIIRSASEGLLSIINANGEVEVMKNSDNQSFVSSLTNHKMFKVGTPYKTFGDWLAIFSIIYILLLTVFLKKKRPV